MAASLEAIASEVGSVFLFRLSDGVLTFDDKADTWPGDRHADPRYFAFISRCHQYRPFLEASLRVYGVSGSAVFAFDLEDLHPDEPDVPTFAFQREKGSKRILLPDVDMLTFDFYISRDHDDETPFDAKRDEAIFVGSTTGDHITEDHVANLRLPRLRSAMFFKNIPDVQFHLPNIVQCDSQRTADMIAALDIGGARRSWQEQLEYKYLLSIDGNGATCSRVYLSLASNSVLFKYSSNHELYYFPYIMPEEQYVLIESDEDVLKWMNLFARDGSKARRIACNARLFVTMNLSRIHQMRYVADLMSQYVALYNGNVDNAVFDGHRFIVDLYAQFDDESVWSAPGGWVERPDGQPIDGLALIPDGPLDSGNLYYYTIAEGGQRSPRANGGEFCGQRRGGQPLHGICVHLTGPISREIELTLSARFADGLVIEEAPAGRPLFHHAPMVALRVTTRRRA